MFCYFLDIRASSYYENDVHIVNIQNGNNIYHVLWYHIKHCHTLKEGQVTLDRSPEFLFKASKLTMLLVNRWRGHFCPKSFIWSKFKYGSLGDIRDLDLVGSNQEILYVSNYKSM